MTYAIACILTNCDDVEQFIADVLEDFSNFGFSLTVRAINPIDEGVEAEFLDINNKFNEEKKLVTTSKIIES